MTRCEWTSTFPRLASSELPLSSTPYDAITTWETPYTRPGSLWSNSLAGLRRNGLGGNDVTSLQLSRCALRGVAWDTYGVSEKFAGARNSVQD
jgi:hypothetical protein